MSRTLARLGGRASIWRPSASRRPYAPWSDRGPFRALRSGDAEPQPSKLLFADQVPHRHRYRPLCIAFTGRRGEGKSLVQTAFGKTQLRRFKRYNAARPDHQKARFEVCANYRVDFADRVDPYLVDQMMEFPDWMRDQHIMLDEFSTVAPSRRSMSNRNVNLSQVFTQIRKRRNDISFTTQFPQVVDLQFLMQVDLFVRCYAIDRDRHGNVTACALAVFDHWGQWTGNDFRKPWPPQRGWEDWWVSIHNLNTVWDDFRTDEEQVPIWYPNREELLRRKGWVPDEGEPIEETGGEEGIRMPGSLEELLDSVRDVVSVMGLLDYARHYDRSITRIALAEMLEKRGYVVERRSSSWMAERPEEVEA